jgi:glycosyltransferase involved in cell wall biosynthesis
VSIAVAPKVSVGVPIYNAEATILRALDSLVSQTHSDIEIIICDDGSTDGTQDVCVNYASLDRRIQYHRSDINRGIPITFAWALSLSRAEFFMWASHDDYWFPKYIETCLGPLEKNSDVVLSCAFTESLSENSTSKFSDLGLTTLGLSPGARYKLYRKKIDAKNDIGGLFYGIHKRSILQQFSPMPSIIANDHVLLAKLALKGCFVTSQETLMQKSFGGISTSHTSNGHAQRVPHPLCTKIPYLIREAYFQHAILVAEGLSLFERSTLMVWSLIQYLRQSIGAPKTYFARLYSDLYFLRVALKRGEYATYKPMILSKRLSFFNSAKVGKAVAGQDDLASKK